MKIENIVIASPMYKEIQLQIEELGCKKNYRFYDDDAVTQADIYWADAFVSFNLKNNFDYHSLKWVHSLGAGVDRFLLHNEWPENVLLTRTIGSFGERIAQYCLSYILRDLQLHEIFLGLTEQKEWRPMTPKLLSEQKVMVYGTGEIGQSVANVLSSFGVDVYGVSLSGRQRAAFKEVMTLEQHYLKLPEMDVLINTLPLTAKTMNLFNETIFNQLANSGFINVGRGASLHEAALLTALEEGKVKYAVLDVFAEEPLQKENKLWNHPAVFLTPHISAVTTPIEGVECFLATLTRIEHDQPLANLVDVHRGY